MPSAEHEASLPVTAATVSGDTVPPVNQSTKFASDSDGPADSDQEGLDTPLKLCWLPLFLRLPSQSVLLCHLRKVLLTV